MNSSDNIVQLQSQVQQCYTYFMDNYKDSDVDMLEDRLTKLQQVMVQLTITNLINIIDKVIEDGRKNTKGENKQYNISSLQIVENRKINLICHEVIGFDNIEKKYLLDGSLSYIDFNDVVRIY